MPALLILLSVLNSKTSTTIIFEEPEAHLFPKDQQRLVELLIYVLNHTQSGNRLKITTHNQYILESYKKNLKKDKIKDMKIDDEDIKKLEPLNSKNISAYLLGKEKISDILNSNLGLIDDKLLSSFNEINTLYDKMRDIEWENTND